MATGLTTVVPAVRPIVKLLLVSLVNTSPTPRPMSEYL